jgi:hypothetical protein
MSDDDEIPDAPPPAVQEASGGWSRQDWRTLIIATVGGLAANVGTVILVGAAIAAVHVSHGHQSFAFAALLTGAPAVAGLLVIAYGIAIRRYNRDLTAIARVAIIFGSVVVLMMVLIWTGLASGVK